MVTHGSGVYVEMAEDAYEVATQNALRVLRSELFPDSPSYKITGNLDDWAIGVGTVELEVGELWAAYPLGTPATFDGTNLRIFRGCMADVVIGQIRGFVIAGSPVRIMECVEMTSDTLTFREV